MEIGNIKGHTRVLGAPPDWNNDEVPVGALAVADVHVDGEPWMVSEWRPTADELAHLMANGSIYLWIHGRTHPVVGVGTDKAVE